MWVVGPRSRVERAVGANVGEDHFAGAERTELPQLRWVVLIPLSHERVASGIEGDNIGVTNILEHKDFRFFDTSIISAGV